MTQPPNRATHFPAGATGETERRPSYELSFPATPGLKPLQNLADRFFDYCVFARDARHFASRSILNSATAGSIFISPALRSLTYLHTGRGTTAT